MRPATWAQTGWTGAGEQPEMNTSSIHIRRARLASLRQRYRLRAVFKRGHASRPKIGLGTQQRRNARDAKVRSRAKPDIVVERLKNVIGLEWVGGAFGEHGTSGGVDGLGQHAAIARPANVDTLDGTTKQEARVRQMVVASHRRIEHRGAREFAEPDDDGVIQP